MTPSSAVRRVASGTGPTKGGAMGGIARKRFEEADDTRSFEHGSASVVKLAGSTAGMFEFQPGWSWSADIKPVVGTDSCQAHHLGYALGGRLRVRSDEGEEMEIGPGDAYEILPGHEGWVLGEE